MKQFNLEEYLANPSKKVVTREGRNVRILCVDKKGGDLPIIALIQQRTRNNEIIGTFTKEGKWSTTIEEQPNDLFFAPEKHEGWFNIYHCDDLGFYIRQNQPYKSKEEADEIAKANFRTFFATVKVEWEE